MTPSFASLSAFHTREYGGKFAVAAALPDLALMAVPRPGPPPGPIAQTLFTGTSGNDSFTGAGADDVFDVFQGGRDTVKGKGGNDTFNFGAEFRANDKVDGGADGGGSVIDARDKIYLDGDYSAEVVFNAATLVGVEAIFMTAGNSYALTTHDTTVAAGDMMVVEGQFLGALDNLTFDGSAETDGQFWLFGGPASDTLTGGAGGDIFTFFGGFAATDRIDGGGGVNSLNLAGDYSAGVAFNPDTIHNINAIFVDPGNDYVFTLNDGNVASGDVLTVWGPSLGAGDKLIVNGSSETDGHLDLTGGAGNDKLTGGKQIDHLAGQFGADRLTPGKGADIIQYSAAADSTSTLYDTVVGFDFDSKDLFDVFVPVTGVDQAVTTGSLSKGSFDADLAAAVSAGHLGANHAVLFQPDAGGLAGKIFLIVDGNGTAGYQAEVDLVILLSGANHLAQVDPADFIFI